MPCNPRFRICHGQPCIAVINAGISRLPDIEGDKPAKKKFKKYPIGYFHLDIAEVRTEEGKLYLFVAIDRTSKLAYVELHDKSNRNVSRVITAPPFACNLRCKTTIQDSSLGDTAFSKQPETTGEFYYCTS